MVDCDALSIWLVEGETKTELRGTIKEFFLEKKVNQHVKAYIKIVIDSKTPLDSAVTLEIRQHQEAVFLGIITSYRVKIESEHLTAAVEAASNTCDMDIEIKRRSFQNDKMTYSQLIKAILGEYPGADCIIDDQLGAKPIGGLLLQFDETDWQFLIRVASGLNTVMVPDAVAAKPKFYFGIPRPQEKCQPKPNTTAYRLVKNTSDFKYDAENKLVNQPAEADFEYFLVEEKGDFLNIGYPVNYQQDLLVYQVTVIKTGSQLIQECLLTTPGGFKQAQKYNENLVGLTLKGTVVECSKGQNDAANIPPVAVKVRLTIDDVYHAKHSTTNPGIYHWFSYATFYAAEGSTGLYCLPETGERVALYFPGCKEAEAFVTNSVRMPGKVTITNPNIKCLRTAFGKKVLFDETGIKIVGKEGTNGGEDLVYIAINDNGAITIKSDSSIELQAERTLTVHADGNVKISANENLTLIKGNCSIVMNGATDFKATNVIKKALGPAGSNVKKITTTTTKGSGTGTVNSSVGTASTPPNQATQNETQSSKENKNETPNEEFILFVATIYGEAGTCSQGSWKAIGHVIKNRVGKREWKKHNTVEKVIKNSGFDAYSQKTDGFNYAYKYLKNKKTGNNTLDKMVLILKPIYNGQEKDDTENAVLYYSPKAQKALHTKYPKLYTKETPSWVNDKVEDVTAKIPGLLGTDDFKFYKYK